MKTTYVERGNTNKEVIRRVQEQLEREKPKATIKNIARILQTQQTKETSKSNEKNRLRNTKRNIQKH